jgi:hypothetical protein
VDTVPAASQPALLDSTVAPKKVKRAGIAADTTDADSTDAAPRKSAQSLPLNLMSFSDAAA